MTRSQKRVSWVPHRLGQRHVWGPVAMSKMRVYSRSLLEDMVEDEAPVKVCLPANISPRPHTLCACFLWALLTRSFCHGRTATGPGDDQAQDF